MPKQTNHWKTLSPPKRKERAAKCAAFRKRITDLDYTPSRLAEILDISPSLMASWTRKTYCNPPTKFALRVISALEGCKAFREYMDTQHPPLPRKPRGKSFAKGNPGRRKRISESNNEPQLLSGNALPNSPSLFAPELKFSSKGWQTPAWPDDPFCDATLQKMGKTLLSIKFMASDDLLSEGNKRLQEACRRAYLRSDIPPGSKNVTIELDYSDFSDDF
jgi:hypothetical protein